MKRHASETTVLRSDGRCSTHSGRICPRIYAQARRDYDPEPEPVESWGGVVMMVAVLLVWFFAIFFAMPVLWTAAAQ